MGVEFATAGVTSPGLDDVLGAANAGLFAPLVTTLVDDLRHANLLSRGYIHLSFTADEVVASHRFVTNIDSRDYAVDADSGQTFSVSRENLELTA